MTDVGAMNTAPAVASEYTTQLRRKILFSLSIYRYLNPSMLHVALGTATPAVLWKQVLSDLIESGVVKETSVMLTSPSERTQTYTVLHLAENEYEAPSVAELVYVQTL